MEKDSFIQAVSLSDILIDDAEWEEETKPEPAKPKLSRQQRRHPQQKHGIFNRLKK
jgi:hypothetical protein